MICVSENEENVLQDRDEELLEERIRGCSVSFGDVADEFQTHVETRIFHFAIVVLARPHARIDNKLELSIIELEKSYRKLVKFHDEDWITCLGSSEG